MRNTNHDRSISYKLASWRLRLGTKGLDHTWTYCRSDEAIAPTSTAALLP
jgi:hypothetical protein